MKVLLLTPDYHCGVVESAGKWPALTLACLAGEARKAGHEPVIYDAMAKNVRLASIGNKIALERPHVVAVTAYTATIPAAMDIFKMAKEILPEIVTVLGGIHGTFCWEEVLVKYPFVDIVVRGEGEAVFPEVLNCLEAGGDLSSVAGLAYRDGCQIHATLPRRLLTVEELDKLEPAYDLLDWQDYTYYIFPGSRLGAINTSRGCKHECTFCSQQKFWNNSWRGLSPGAVARQITTLVKDFNVDTLLLADEHPTCDRERFEAILDWLIEQQLGLKLMLTTRADDIVRDMDIMHKYRKAGIVHIYVGIEATDQEALDKMRKGTFVSDARLALKAIKNAGMVTETSFVLGSPEETAENINRTLALAKEYDPDFAHFLFLTPWPYSDIYSDVKHLIAQWDYSKYNLVEPVIIPPAFTRDELFNKILFCYQNFYMHKLKSWANEPDYFRKEYMVRSLQVMLGNSFLTRHVPVFGKMPVLVQQLFKELGVPAAFFRI